MYAGNEKGAIDFPMTPSVAIIIYQSRLKIQLATLVLVGSPMRLVLGAWPLVDVEGTQISACDSEPREVKGHSCNRVGRGIMSGKQEQRPH